MEHREALQVLMNRILPKGGIGSLLSQHCSEIFYASVLVEPVGKQGGLRAEWQEFLRAFLSSKGLSPTLRYAAQRALQLLRSAAKKLT